MATLKTISAALKLIDTKKENLRKAYDELQSHSSLLSSFPLSWSELDSHFTSIQSDLNRRYHHLENLNSQRNNASQPHPIPSVSSTGPSSLSNPDTRNPSNPSSSSNPQTHEQNVLFPSQNPSKIQTQKVIEPPASGVTDSGLHPPDLRVLCEKMDVKGIQNYVSDHLNKKEELQIELQAALLCAPDPAGLVLESLVSSIGTEGMKEPELGRLRRSCKFLLEQLRGVSEKIGCEVKEKAQRLAAEWRVKFAKSGAKSLEAVCVLLFVVVYGLSSEFSVNELVNFAASSADNEEVPELCRVLGLEDKVPVIVQRLVTKNKHLLAVKYIFEFNLSEKIQPVPILKACVQEAKRLTKNSLEGRNPFKTPSKSMDHEIQTLKSVIKVIEDHKLSAIYPPQNIEQRIQNLEKQKGGDKKRPAAVTASNSQPQQQQHQRKKQKQKHQQHNRKPNPWRITAAAGLASTQMNVASSSSTLHQYHQPHLQPAGLLPDPTTPYMNSTAVPYGVVGHTASNIAPYTGQPSGPYAASVSHTFLSETQAPSSYYDRSTVYGAYGLQSQYHPSYYSQ